MTRKLVVQGMVVGIAVASAACVRAIGSIVHATNTPEVVYSRGLYRFPYLAEPYYKGLYAQFSGTIVSFCDDHRSRILKQSYQGVIDNQGGVVCVEAENRTDLPGMVRLFMTDLQITGTGRDKGFKCLGDNKDAQNSVFATYWTGIQEFVGLAPHEKRDFLISPSASMPSTGAFNGCLITEFFRPQHNKRDMTYRGGFEVREQIGMVIQTQLTGSVAQPAILIQNPIREGGNLLDNEVRYLFKQGKTQYMELVFFNPSTQTKHITITASKKPRFMSAQRRKQEIVVMPQSYQYVTMRFDRAPQWRQLPFVIDAQYTQTDLLAPHSTGASKTYYTSFRQTVRLFPRGWWGIVVLVVIMIMLRGKKDK